jgi:hypothetical protein
MTRRVLIAALAALVAGFAVARSAGDLAFWRDYVAAAHGRPPPRTIHVPGGDGGVLPRATPAEQGLDDAALAAAAATAAASAGRAGDVLLLVARRGHLVFESAAGAVSLRPSPLLSRLALLAGAAASAAPQTDEVELQAQVSALAAWSLEPPAGGSSPGPWSARARARFGPAPASPLPGGGAPQAFPAAFSRDLWSPLGAGAALWAADGHGLPRLHCCLWLRPRDGLALAVALQGGGQLEGRALLGAGRASAVLSALDDGVTPRGAEAFGARAVRMLRDDAGTRLYFFPAQELVILLLGADESRLGDETALAHQVLRGIVDSVPASSASQVVPLH